MVVNKILCLIGPTSTYSDICPMPIGSICLNNHVVDSEIQQIIIIQMNRGKRQWELLLEQFKDSLKTPEEIPTVSWNIKCETKYT